MQHYYDKNGKVLGKAWGFSRCWSQVRDAPRPDDHEPHSHDPMYAMYGPYFCPGFPETEIYDQKPREPLNPQPLYKQIAKLVGENEILSPNQIKESRE